MIAILGPKLVWARSKQNHEFRRLAALPHGFSLRGVPEPEYRLPLAPKSTAAQPTRNLIWIASYPKSGNTWVRLILRAATGAKIALGEPDDVSVSFADRLRFHLQSQGIALSDPGESRRYWREVQGMCSALLTRHAPFKVKFLKTHAIAGTFDVGPFPDPALTAGVIHIVRDPRDVVLSMAHHFSVPVEVSVQRLMQRGRILSTPDNLRAELVADWGTHLESWRRAPLPRKLFLRYEDMLEEPGQAVAKILEFAGVKATRARVRACAEATGFSALQAAEADTGFVEAPRETFFRAGNAGQWRDEDPALFAPVLDRYGQQMQALGYL